MFISKTNIKSKIGKKTNHLRKKLTFTATSKKTYEKDNLKYKILFDSIRFLNPCKRRKLAKKKIFFDV